MSIHYSAKQMIVVLLCNEWTGAYVVFYFGSHTVFPSFIKIKINFPSVEMNHGTPKTLCCITTVSYPTYHAPPFKSRQTLALQSHSSSSIPPLLPRFCFALPRFRRSGRKYPKAIAIVTPVKPGMT